MFFFLFEFLGLLLLCVVIVGGLFNGVLFVVGEGLGIVVFGLFNFVFNLVKMVLFGFWFGNCFIGDV